MKPSTIARRSLTAMLCLTASCVLMGCSGGASSYASAQEPSAQETSAGLEPPRPTAVDTAPAAPASVAPAVTRPLETPYASAAAPTSAPAYTPPQPAFTLPQAVSPAPAVSVYESDTPLTAFNPMGGLYSAGRETRVSFAAQPRTASSTVATPPAPAPARKYRVIATAEGLIGGVTASGTVITAYMQGAALPSKQGLSKKIHVTYLANGRSNTCRVLDVGPWNISDTYWERPDGRPSAEKGRDQFGRKTNMAGIDLFNGTWYKLLGLRTYDRWLIENTTGRVEWAFVP